MASFGRPRVLGRIVVLLMIIVALVVGGLVWFDYLGLIDAKTLLGPGLRGWSACPRARGKALPAESPALLEEERLAKRSRRSAPGARSSTPTRSAAEREAESRPEGPGAGGQGESARR